MSDRIVIPFDPQILRRHADPKPAWGMDEDGLVWLRCQCGFLVTLDHTVAADGEVNPSLWHNSPPLCDWHVWGKLEGWNGGDQDFSSIANG